MNYFQAFIMGIIQALTEYFPVSSSAHLRIYGALIHTDPGAAFTAIIQFGTEAAVLLYFRREVAAILRGWFGALFGRDGKDWHSRLGAHDRQARLGWYIILATVPIVVFGILLQKWISGAFRNLWVTVASLIILGVILWVVDARCERTKQLDDLTWKDSLWQGLGQVLSLVPGCSRSGSTITVGRLLGYDREAAARFSFLMSLPAIFGSGLYEAYDSLKHPDYRVNGVASAFPAGWNWGTVLVATLTCFVVGYLVIIIFLKIVSTFSYRGFAYYRIGIAVVVALLLLAGVLTPYAGGSLAG